MRFSDIKVKHIYNVIFDDVRPCEFDGRHLALVIKRNNDKNTFIVMPLTSEPNGVGVNKIKLDTINSLPSSLRGNITYAVYNQIRTVNASRFISLKEGSNVIHAKIDDDTFDSLLILGIQELLFNLDQDEKIVLLGKAREKECITKAKDLAYNIIRLQKEIENKEAPIESIKKEIKETLNNVTYKLEQKYIDDGIKDIFDNIFKEQ
ncbi:MAG: type II toxin-antitoxin system PemK/MazF family toxin [Clostridia bacterium]|nr:type II toxin-antitoxin system PemK/MazF family toxin [Clostridia bacterium]